MRPSGRPLEGITSLITCLYASIYPERAPNALLLCSCRSGADCLTMLWFVSKQGLNGDEQLSDTCSLEYTGSPRLAVRYDPGISRRLLNICPIAKLLENVLSLFHLFRGLETISCIGQVTDVTKQSRCRTSVARYTHKRTGNDRCVGLRTKRPSAHAVAAPHRSQTTASDRSTRARVSRTRSASHPAHVFRSYV